ncbi:uncharacterized protein LOC144618910 [Crassostrea virginica]
MRTTTCLIGGVCYDGGVSNPINSCQRCSPASSQFTWTTATAAGCFPPPSTTEASPPNKTAVSMNSQTVVIIASITAVIFLIICIVLATVFIVRYRAQRKKEKFMKRYETDPSVYNNGASRRRTGGRPTATPQGRPCTTTSPAPAMWPSTTRAWLWTIILNELTLDSLHGYINVDIPVIDFRG